MQKLKRRKEVEKNSSAEKEAETAFTLQHNSSISSEITRSLQRLHRVAHIRRISTTYLNPSRAILMRVLMLLVINSTPSLVKSIYFKKGPLRSADSFAE